MAYGSKRLRAMPFLILYGVSLYSAEVIRRYIKKHKNQNTLKPFSHMHCHPELFLTLPSVTALKMQMSDSVNPTFSDLYSAS